MMLYPDAGGHKPKRNMAESIFWLVMLLTARFGPALRDRLAGLRVGVYPVHLQISND
jgi:hypothetical protein